MDVPGFPRIPGCPRIPEDGCPRIPPDSLLSPYAGAVFRIARLQSGYWGRLFREFFSNSKVYDFGAGVVRKGSQLLDNVLKLEFPFREGNFRDNLARLWGLNPPPAGYDAHHVFPRKHEALFNDLGVDIHDPAFGAWWEDSAHRAAANEYNELWRKWLYDHPNASLDQVIDYGRELADDYKFIWGF